MLSRNALTVTGIDLSEEAICKAKTIYSAENITYVQADIKSLPFQDNTFDIVVSFETLEHIPEYKNFLQECKRVLKPNGHLIISTPNALISSPQGTIINPYHVVEFKPEEFTSLLSEQFPSVELHGQRDTDTVQKELLSKWNSIKKQIKPLGAAIQIIRAIIALMRDEATKTSTPDYPVSHFSNGLIKSAYMIAICQKLK